MLSALAVTAWQGILENIEQHTTSQQFATWFRNLQVEQLSPEKVVLAVPSKFHRDWIATYYLDVVEAAVKQVLGRPAPLHLEVSTRDTADPTAVGGGRRPGAPGAEATTAPSGAATSPNPARPAPRAVAVRTSGDLPLIEGFDFDHFVVGQCNQLAQAAGQSLAGPARTDFATLFVVGGTGLGKTHLLQAIAREAAARADGERAVAYVRAESFVNEFITACAGGDSRGEAARFRDRYRNLDFVCFDDLQLLAGKAGSQQELQHACNAWADRGTRVVLGASCMPGENLNLDPNLLARFAGAFRVTLRAPDLETREQLVIAKAKVRGETLPSDVVRFLAELPASNVRELEGALTSVIASSRLTNTPITLRSVRQALQDDSLLQRPASSPDRILKAICQHFELTVADLCSPRRPQALSFARQTAMYLLRERTELSLSEIGQFLGGRDHTTILHGVRKIEEGARDDGRVREHLARVRQQLDH